MRWVTAHHKGFSICEKSDEPVRRQAEGFAESITPGGVHELLFEPAGGNAFPLFPALLTACSQVKPDDSDRTSKPPRTLAWVDATGSFYPPAAMGAGIGPGQICLLQPQSADLVWATIESLRCRSIGAVVAVMMQPLTRVEVRRLQLAAESGGGIAVLIRPNIASAASHIYAAATRWLVAPAPGERTIQRWHLELIHGHGRRLGQSFILEKHRASGQTHFMHLSPALVDHPKISAAS